MSDEIWKETEFSGYWVSNFGNVQNRNRHHKNIKLECKKYTTQGYAATWMRREDSIAKLVKNHRLVAKAFILGDTSLTVNHKNGIRNDNRAENLEWLSFADNERHARKVLGKRLFGEKASRSKLLNEDVIEVRILGMSGMLQKDIAIAKRISQAQVSRILLKQNWSHL